MIMQSSSNGCVTQMQDILNIEIRMNEPGIGKIDQFIFKEFI